MQRVLACAAAPGVATLFTKQHTTTHNNTPHQHLKKKRDSEPTNGAAVVARRLEEVARSIAAGAAPPAPNALARLRDTVVFGYLMASAKGEARVDVPEW